MKKYFITVSFLKPKNKLEQALQDAFAGIENTIICEADAWKLKELYDKVIAGYKGKVVIEYEYAVYTNENMRNENWISIRMDQTRLHLTEISSAIKIANNEVIHISGTEITIADIPYS